MASGRSGASHAHDAAGSAVRAAPGGGRRGLQVTAGF